MAYATSAQTAFFVDKKGKKTVMRDDAVEVILIDKRISYKQVGKTWEKYIKFDELDHVKWDAYYLKTFRISGKKKDRLLFVNIESPTKKLLSIAVEVSSTSSTGFTSSSTHYEVLVIDNSNMVIDELKFTAGNRYEDERALLAPMIRKHFSDCPNVMSKITSTESAMEQINSPEYFTCQ